jgi:hypothetical protein
MEAAGSSETLVPNYETRWHHVPEEYNHDTHSSEALKSHYKPMFELIFYHILHLN